MARSLNELGRPRRSLDAEQGRVHRVTDRAARLPSQVG
jgi:hypothetical protein